ncbi:hypothetical protein FIBSPDRAFT_479935 [Athelia psychrophila]|uniref:Uncharacterized protein n=1 Tax=Athelia psychrophila TaxID=1759441 RepID=A0A166VD72_9AGAM|nr:hypothetical protein FIBSPDRAFT_479935 [Fibularhizoctonia sp. CBS 109695]
MASFRFWISESANNSTCTQRPAQKNPLRQSSVIRSAPSGFKTRETITNSRRTRRIEHHDAGSESDEEYDNRKRRYSGHGADTTVVHNRPSDRSEYGTRRRSKSHQRSTAKRQRTQITNAITSNPRDVIGMMGESDSDEFSDTTVSVSRSVTGQTLAEAAAELRHWKILAEKAEVNALRKKVNQVKAEIQYYKKKVRDITERLNV